MTKNAVKIATFLCCCSTLAFSGSKHRKDIPEAPLPTVIEQATDAFLVNGGGSGNELAFDAFYAAFKQWGKFHLADKPKEAQIVVQLDYRIVDEGTRVWSSTNTYTNTTQVHSARITDPQLVVSIYDANTKDLLWSTTDHRPLAKLEKNRQKETINSAERLVEDLKSRLQDAPADMH